MAKLKLKFRDISRMTKKYPYTRHLPRTQLVSDKEFDLEVLTVNVSESDEKIVTWEKAFSSVPNVTVSIVMQDGATGLPAEMPNVNAWIKSATTSGCVIAFSDTFTGTINIQAIRFS